MLLKIDTNELETKLDAEAGKIALEVANELTNQLQIEAPTGATGRLQGSFQIFYQGDGVVWLGTRVPYALDVWKGTGPHIADFDAIKVWARRKLGSEAAAGPVWRKIAQEGTNSNDYVGRAMENTLQRFR